MSPPTIERKQILTVNFGHLSVTTADIREITLAPGLRAGRHLHPCAVLGYIARGAAIYQIEGETEQMLPAGSAFYEPANKVIAEFGNASGDEPLTFIAFYLLNGEQELITMLPPKE